MSDKKFFVMVHPEARRRAMSAVADAPDGYCVTVQPPKRSLDQNSLLWPLLTCFSEQLLWPVIGQMVKMPTEDWKHVLSAAFQKEQARLAMGLDGGVVMLGMRTSQMGKREFSEFIEFLMSVAVERGVAMNEAETA